MAFRFTLAAVLKVRESIEEREKLALERIQHEISQIRLSIDVIAEEQQKDVRTREEALRTGVPAGLLMAIQHDQERLKQTRAHLERKLAELVEQRNKQLVLYREARRNREVISELRKRQAEAYRLEEAKRQQKMLDDIFIARHTR